jgi:cytochrome c biogenesis protein CcmG, thiol:disulfide interchange protein DsbE
MRYLRRFIATLTIMLSVNAACAAQPATAAAPPNAVSVGGAPELKGTTLNGKGFDLASEKGKVTLVAFWATWCPTCRQEIPRFRKLYEELRSKGFELVLVSIDDEMADVEDYVRVVMQTTRESQSFPMIWRKQAGVTDSFGKIRGTPSTYLLDRNGKIAAITRGALKPADYETIRTTVASR